VAAAYVRISICAALASLVAREAVRLIPPDNQIWRPVWISQGVMQFAVGVMVACEVTIVAANLTPTLFHDAWAVALTGCVGVVLTSYGLISFHVRGTCGCAGAGRSRLHRRHAIIQFVARNCSMFGGLMVMSFVPSPGSFVFRSFAWIPMLIPSLFLCVCIAVGKHSFPKFERYPGFSKG
jgi:hypothetical protein